MSDGYRHGKHVWREHWSDNAEASRGWYAELLGWELKAGDMGDFEYWMFKAGGKALGGFSTLTADQKAMGAPPHWLTYVSVDDVDACCARATDAGGKIYAPPFDLPEVGRMAVLADPAGAVFALFKGTTSDPEFNAPPPPMGDIWWAELMTNDVAASRAFYGKTFGWQTETMPMGDAEYTVFLQGADGASAGCLALPADVKAPPHWALYFVVEDADAAAVRATASGGAVVVPPQDVPSVGRFAFLADPQGAVFGVIVPDLSAQAG